MTIKLKDQNSNDGNADFLERFDQDKAKKIFDLLKIGPQDTVNIHEGTALPPLIQNTRHLISMDIMSAYMISPPTMLKDKNVYPKRS